MRLIRVVIVLLMAAALVSACGGGGGGGGSRPQTTAPLPPPQEETPPPPPPPPPPCIQTAELGCLSSTEYVQKRDEIADLHNGEEDFKNQWGLSTIRADRAYAQLELKHGVGTEPGSGITVGVIDTGIDTGHPVFAGKTVTEEFLSGAKDETGDKTSHGTAVASMIAGKPGPDFTENVTAARGVAWGADVAMFAIRAGAASGKYVPVSLAGLKGGDDVWEGFFRRVIEWNSGGRSLDFVNLSVGYRGIIDQYSEQELRDNFDDTIAALAQSSASNKTVFVWSAGNAHGFPCDAADFPSGSGLCVNGSVVAQSVEVLSGLPARISQLRGHHIAVVAIGGNGEIASFSNRCGIAADFCLAAPGAGVRAAYFGPHPDDDTPGARGAYTASGTSFSAPMVTGGLAVMKHYFRDQLSNTALVARLLATANKEGIYSDSDTYGQGLMDLAAATSPVGGTIITMGKAARDAGSGVGATGIALGRAFGDGLRRSLAGREIAAFDKLGAPFWFELADFVSTDDGLSSLARLRALTAGTPITRYGPDGRVAFAPGRGGGATDRNLEDAWLRLGFLEAPAGIGDGHLSFARDAMTVTLTGRHGVTGTAFTTDGIVGRAPVSGAALSFRSPFPAVVPIGVSAGWLGERRTLLGTAPAGVFGDLSADAVFGGIETGFEAGGWRLAGRAEIGTVIPHSRGGMVTGLSPLVTSAFELTGTQRLAGGDSMTIGLSQPLRVEGGRLSLSVPIGRTREGAVLRSSLTTDLTPSGREIDLSARWRSPRVGVGDLLVEFGLTRHPGHDAHSKPAVRLLVGWRFAF